MNRIWLVIALLLPGCTRLGHDKCASVPMSEGYQCPKDYCPKELRKIIYPDPPTTYECVPKKCEGKCAQLVKFD